MSRNAAVRNRPRPRRRLGAALAALLAAGLAGGCGSSSHGAGTSADPAGLTPAGVPLYIGATVRPGDAQAKAALAAGHALTHQTNPFLKLIAVLQTPGSPPLDYNRDIAGWLGPHAGLFLRSAGGAQSMVALAEGALTGRAVTAGPSFGNGQADGALVLDTSDSSKARSFLSSQARHAGAHPAAYHGVSYEASSSGLALGMVGRFAVIGSEAGMHAVIDTSRGAASLASSAPYAKLAGGAPAEAIAHLYVDPAAAGGASGRTAGLLEALSGGRTTDVSLVPSAAAAQLDIDTLPVAGRPGGLLAPDPEGARALAGLPGESWLAVGLGHLSQKLQSDVGSLKALVSLLGGEGSLGGLLEGLLAPVEIMGADTPAARAAFGSWQRSAAIFASGSGLLELRGGIVIDSSDAARSKAAVGALAAALSRNGGSVSRTSIPGTEAAVSARLRGLPLALDIAAGRGAGGAPKFVLGLGPASVTAALAPASTFAGDPARGAAAKAIGGGEPALVLQVPTLLGLIEGIGLAESPPLDSYLPFLRALRTIAGGAAPAGAGVERFRLSLGLSG